MIVRVPAVLSAEQLAAARAVLADAPWADGRVTAGYQSARVKENLQLPEDCDASRKLRELVISALERNPLFMSAALPARVFPPLFNRYEAGMNFGAHVDNAIRAVTGTAHRIRTDASATLFLSNPTSLHRVTPVTRGARIAAFLWVQSMVKDDGQRSILFDLDRSIAELTQTAPDSPALVRLTACYHNLVRRWAEI